MIVEIVKLFNENGKLDSFCLDKELTICKHEHSKQCYNCSVYYGNTSQEVLFST